LTYILAGLVIGQVCTIGIYIPVFRQTAVKVSFSNIFMWNIYKF